MKTRFAVLALVFILAAPSHALADPDPDVTREAGQHFQRGVGLYNEADYRAALVEFKRAYEIAPNSLVLYNIGQTYFQLQNYASALTMFEKYLAEAGSTATHRSDAEQSVAVLRARVGKLQVSANVSGCDVTIDDELVGKTPLDKPLLVSIGQRRVIVGCPGRAVATRTVEVAAGDVVPVSMTIAEPTSAGGGKSTKGADAAPEEATGPSRGAVTIAWLGTGALAVGAVVTGTLALTNSNSLAAAREKFPANHDDLEKKASVVSNLALATDILGASAIVLGGLSLYLTVSRSSSHEARVSVAPGRVELNGSF